LSFQFAARRLRVLLRGVFHFRFATVVSVYNARARARISVRTAHATEAFAVVAATQPHRHVAQHQLLRQVGDVETASRQDIALAERVVIATDVRIESLVEVEMHVALDVFQASIAFPVGVCVDLSFYMKQMIGVVQLEMHPRR